MRLAYLIGGVVAMMTVVSPAVAQTATNYYIVQNTSTKRCTIVEVMPTLATSVVLGDVVYKSDRDAVFAMVHIKSCGLN